MSIDWIPVTEEHEDYLHDESKTTGKADYIAFPKTEEELIELMKAEGPITLQGGKTGLAAGGVPQSGRLISLEKMKAACPAFAEGGKAFISVQSGALLMDIRRLCEESGYYFPPDPTESSASIGGMAACNASGAKSYRYGPTRNHIEGFRMVLPDGDVLALKRGQVFAKGRHFVLTTEGGKTLEGDLPSCIMPRCKNAAGYYAEDNMDMVDLFIGSDGTLGVFSELTLKLLPMPKVMWGMNCFFESEEIALRFVKKAKALDLVAIEAYDANALDILRRNTNGELSIPEKYKSLIYVEIHTDTQEKAEDIASAVCDVMDLCGGSSEDTWLGDSESAKAQLLLLRHKVPESVNAIIAERKRTYPGLSKAGTDMAVPDECLEAVLDLYHQGLAEKGFEYAYWGHIGNNHLHINVLPRNMEELKEAKELYKEWATKIVAMGGSVSAEHGIGKSKAALLWILYGEKGLAESRQVKRIFDPQGKLNPGNWGL